MGWVTLTLRKTELKRTHADYQKRLLDISREKRQMAREYHYEQTCVQNEQQAALRTLYSNYRIESDAVREQISGLDSTQADYRQQYDNLQNKLAQIKEDYELNKNTETTDWEDELAMIEEEANNAETILDQEQVQIEAQLQAISAEIDAVDGAIGDQISKSTIKLS